MSSSIKGKTVLITAGPTYEPIDPVRFIGNHSSGKMGYALAKEALEQGAKVILISGPVALMPPAGAETISVTTAEEMYQACLSEIKKADVAVFAAAVADYTPKQVSARKIKKQNEDGITLELIPTKDIAAAMGKLKRTNQFFVGFALETDSEFQNAQAKLHKKNLDMIVLNSMNDEGAGFKKDTNRITIIKPDGTVLKFGLKSKLQVAKDILSYVL